MISGVTFVLLGESILSGAVLVFGWFLFWIGSSLAFTPMMEEPELEERFGEAYRQYQNTVPRWLPRPH